MCDPKNQQSLRQQSLKKRSAQQQSSPRSNHRLATENAAAADLFVLFSFARHHLLGVMRSFESTRGRGMPRGWKMSMVRYFFRPNEILAAAPYKGPAESKKEMREYLKNKFDALVSSNKISKKYRIKNKVAWTLNKKSGRLQ